MVKVLGAKVPDETYNEFQKLSNNNISELLRKIIHEYIKNHSPSHHNKVNLAEIPVNHPIEKKTEQDMS